MPAGDPKLQITLGQALLLMNALRRVTAFVGTTQRTALPVDVATAIRELLEPVVRDLGELADQLPRDQFSAALHASSAWRADYRRATPSRSGRRRRPVDRSIAHTAVIQETTDANRR